MSEPTVIVVARNVTEGLGYALSLPDRHVRLMDHYRAVNGGLRGLLPGAVVHALPIRVAAGHGVAVSHEALDRALVEARRRGVEVKRVRR